MSEDKRDKWEMPKPIFRQTSGSLPKGFAKKEERWDDTAEPHRSTAAPPVQAPHDPKDDMLITMYAPPGALVDKSLFESDAEPETAKEPENPVMPAAAIEEQPSISEQFTVDESVVQPPKQVKGKSGFGKLFLSLGILILLAVAVGIGVYVYYYYYASSAENSIFS